MKVFISWSGATSRAVAEALGDWIPKVIQNVEPFISAKDIDKGANWTVELARELEDSEFGIVCLAPDNLLSPWLNYETGAITKSVNSRVAPVLFGVEKNDVQPPMAQLQLTMIDKEDFKLLIGSISKAADSKIEPNRIEEAVDVWWPSLEKVLSTIQKPDENARSRSPKPSEPPQPQIDAIEMLEEILHRMRQVDSRVQQLGDQRTQTESHARNLSRRGSALRYLRQKSEDADLEVISVKALANDIEVIVANTLPEPLPAGVIEAGATVARRELMEVRFVSPERVISVSPRGETTETPF